MRVNDLREMLFCVVMKKTEMYTIPILHEEANQAEEVGLHGRA